MNWTFINESANIIAIATGILPATMAFLKRKKQKWVVYLFAFLFIVTVLDITTFYYYKATNKSLHWINPFYVFNTILFLPLFNYFSNEDKAYKKMILYSQTIIWAVILIRMIFFVSFTNYDQWTMFIVQLNFQVFALINLYFVFNRANKSPRKNPLFNINLGILIMFLMPLLSSFIQVKLYETSPDYYQMSLMVINISAIIGYLLVFRGLQLLK